MNKLLRNKIIYETHKAHPTWGYQALADLFGLSRQRIYQIVRQAPNSAIMGPEMVFVKNYRVNGEAVSASKISAESGIPYSTIAQWVRRGMVKVLKHPGHKGPGNPVLLDPVTLQERIDKYQPRPRRNQVAVS